MKGGGLRWVTAALTLGCLVGGGQSLAADETDATGEEVDFAALVERAYAEPFRRGDLEGWLAAFAEDAVALHNRRPADQGIAAIRKFAEMVFATFRAARFELSVLGVKRVGDIAWVHGVFDSHLVFRESGESAPWGPEQGKFLLMWQSQGDGEWRVVVDMGNASN